MVKGAAGEEPEAVVHVLFECVEPEYDGLFGYGSEEEDQQSAAGDESAERNAESEALMRGLYDGYWDRDLAWSSPSTRT